MDKSRYSLGDDICLDARRALWLRGPSVLVIADLHLGYAWAHRHNGQLLPIKPQPGDESRLLNLIHDYCPKTVVLLGDIVHRAISLPPLKKELCSMLTAIGERAELILLAGNHDRRLRQLLTECGILTPLVPEICVGHHLLIHGDMGTPESVAERREAAARSGGRIFIGHEHPSITVTDRVATSVKCPCFLVSSTTLVLPAFSDWSAGSNVRSGKFMSPYANGIQFTQAVAVMGEKLLPVSLNAPKTGVKPS